MKLNGSLTTTELQKPHPSRLVGGAQTQNRLVPHPHVDKNSRGTSQAWGVPAPHQEPQSRVPVPERRAPTTSGCKNQGGLSQQNKLLESQAVPLKEPKHGLTQIHSKLQHWGNSLKAARGIQGGTEVAGIKARAGGEPSPKQKGG